MQSKLSGRDLRLVSEKKGDCRHNTVQYNTESGKCSVISELDGDCQDIDIDDTKRRTLTSNHQTLKNMRYRTSHHTILCSNIRQ